jgi:Uma2 family endonuclease
MAQLIELLSELPVMEYLDGEARRKVSPRSRHSRVQWLMGMLLERCGAEFGMAGTEWDFRIGLVDRSNSFLVPDVAFVSFDRLRAIDRKEREQPPIAPDIAVEVWSPKNDRAFLNRKIAKYLANGSSLVLDVDPRRRTIDAHAAGGATHFTEGERFEHPAAPWLVFDVAEAFKGLDLLD